MFRKVLPKYLLLPFILVFSLVLSGFASSTSSAMSMMEHSAHLSTDVVTCMVQHQNPAAPVSKEVRQLNEEDDDDPLPVRICYLYPTPDRYAAPNKKKSNRIVSSSFRPPDIVILTANLRI